MNAATDVLGVHEFEDTATGAQALDAAVKVAPVTLLRVRVINPGKLVIILTGDVASVELSLKASREVAGDRLLDELFLPQVDPGVVTALAGDQSLESWDAMGIVETATVTAGIAAADLAVKRAEVKIAEIRIDDSMGGRASVRLIGPVGEVEAAIDAAESYTMPRSMLVRSVLIPNPHDDLRAYLAVGKDSTP
jgi:microcompartment protein CcmL/EutN